ncbi:MAG: glycosyltransferase family 39 protein, partial [Nitrospinaceae bacterium]
MITFDKEKHSLKAPVTLAFFFALLCLLGLNVPLNGDEGKTYLVHVDSTAWHLLVHFDWTHPHTLFSILSNTSMRIFGENEVAFRLPAFFAGVLSVFLIHRLGQSLWNSTTATIASLLMMGSYHHLVFSQHGRGYAITELLALASVFGTIFLLDEKSSKIGEWVLIFSGIALCVTLPSNAFFLPGCGLAFLFVVYESKNPAVCLSWYRLGRKLLPFFILAALMIGYFLMIYDDLSLGLKREMA